MAHVLCIGNAVQDFVFSLQSMPGTAEKFRASGFETMGGGPAATAAVAIVKLGGRATLATRLGDDRIAGIVIEELQDYGVDCSLANRFEDCASSLSSVFVDDDGERLIVNYLDPDMPESPDWLPESLPDGVDAVLADTRWPEGALHMLQLAVRAGVPAVLDADAPVPTQSELPGAATHVAFSAPGLAEFTSEDDPDEGLRAADRRTEGWCCVTLGSRGTRILMDGTTTSIDACRVPVRDTLGAGDVWHGAFALALAEGQQVEDAVYFASAAAAAKVRNGAGRRGSPTREEALDLLQHMKPEAHA